MPCFHMQWVKDTGELSEAEAGTQSPFPLNLCCHLQSFWFKKKKNPLLLSLMCEKKTQVCSTSGFRSKFLYVMYDEEIILTFTFPWKIKQNVYYYKLFPMPLLKCYTSIKIRLLIEVIFSPSIYPHK